MRNSAQSARRPLALLLVLAMLSALLPSLAIPALAAETLKFQEGSDKEAVMIDTDKNYSAFWKTSGSDSGWKYAVETDGDGEEFRRLTFLDLNAPDASFEETGDMFINVAGTNRVGTLRAGGDICVMGTGLLIVDELDVAGELAVSEVAVFLKQEGGEYLLLSSGRLQDVGYILPAGNEYVMPAGTALTLEVKAEGANLAEPPTESFTSKLIIPENTALTLRGDAEIVMECVYWGVGNSIYYTGKLDVAGTLTLEDSSRISGLDRRNRITLAETGAIFCNDGGVLSGVCISGALHTQSFRLTLDNCMLDFYGDDFHCDKGKQFAYQERALTVITNSTIYLKNRSSEELKGPMYFAFDSVTLLNAESRLAVGMDRNFDLTIRDGVTGKGMLSLLGAVTNIYGTGVSVGTLRVVACTANVLRTEGKGPAIAADLLVFEGARIYARGSEGQAAVLAPAEKFPKGTAEAEEAAQKWPPELSLITDTFIWAVGGMKDPSSGEDISSCFIMKENDTENVLHNRLCTEPTPDAAGAVVNWMAGRFELTLHESALAADGGFFSSLYEQTAALLPKISAYKGADGVDDPYTFEALSAALTPSPFDKKLNGIFAEYAFSHFELLALVGDMPQIVRIFPKTVPESATKVNITDALPEGATVLAVSAIYITIHVDVGAGGDEKSSQSAKTGKGTLGSNTSDALSRCAVGAHIYSAYTTKKEATCTTTGSKDAKCKVCSKDVFQSIPALGHKYVTSTKAATCTSAGSSVQTCSRCKAQRNATTIPAKGHSYSNGKCSVCGAGSASAPPPAAVAVNPAENETKVTDLSVSATVKSDGAGNLTVTLSKETEQEVLKTLQSDGKTVGTIEIKIEAPTGETVRAISLDLSPALLAAAAKNDSPIAFTSPIGGMALTPETLNGLATQLTAANARLECVIDQEAALTEAQQSAVGDNASFALLLQDEKGKELSFTGSITITVLFPPVVGEHPSGYELLHVGDDGTMTKVPCVFTAGKAVFKAEHFSIYTIRYNAALVWEHSFADVSMDNWFYDAVRYVCKDGLFLGTSDTRFSPEAPMTRGMLVTVLWRLAGEPAAPADAPVFADVKPGAYYETAVRWAAQNDIVRGIGADRFAPEDILSREQAVTLLFRYADFAGHDVSAQDGAPLAAFRDAAAVSDWAYEALCWAVNTGIVKGNGDGTLAPQDENTRAHTAQLLYNCAEKWQLLPEV